MESILGVHNTLSPSASQDLSEDAILADQQDQDDLRGRLRDRYVRTFWEPVAEGAVSDGLLPRLNAQLMDSSGPCLTRCPPTCSSGR